MKEPTAAQIEVLKQTINDTSNDLEYVTEFLVAELRGAVGVEESVIRKAVQTAAQRCLWLAVWDKALSLGLDLPEYSELVERRRGCSLTQRPHGSNSDWLPDAWFYRACIGPRLTRQGASLRDTLDTVARGEQHDESRVTAGISDTPHSPKSRPDGALPHERDAGVGRLSVDGHSGHRSF